MRIVCVDDEPLFLHTVADFLRRCGHEVVTAGHGVDALSEIEQHLGTVDLVLSDVYMPHSDGPSLLRAIKARHPGIDVVLITAFAQRLSASALVEDGACALLRKPIKLGELELVIQQIDQRRGERAQLCAVTQTLQAEYQARAETVRDRIFARRLHSRILPRDFGFMPLSRFHLRHLPQGAVGGDFIDVRAAGEHRCLILVADVSGHGTPAAFGSIALKTWFHGLRPGLGPCAVLAEADGLFADLFPPEYYATAFCAIYDERDRRLAYCLAGHPPPLICDQRGTVRLLAGSDPAVGIEATCERHLHHVELGEHELCLVYTDGLVEEAEPLARGLSERIEAGRIDHADLDDLQRLATRILDTAIEINPLRAFSDDLSLLAFGPARPGAPEAQVALHGKRVLLLGASAALATTLHQRLASRACQLTALTTAEALPAHLRQEHTDLVLIADDTAEDPSVLIAELRACDQSLPVLLLAVRDPESAARRGLDAEVAGVCAWPCPEAVWIEAVENALSFDPQRDRIEYDEIGADWLDFVISSSATSLDLLARYLEALGRQPVPAEALAEVIYCIKEIAGNALEWGNRRNPQLSVRISTVILPDRVLVKIADEGSGFNPQFLLDPEHLLDAQRARDELGKRPGGFGLSLVHAKMDKVAYNRRGNGVVLTKLFTASPPIDEEQPAHAPRPTAFLQTSALDPATSTRSPT